MDKDTDRRLYRQSMLILVGSVAAAALIGALWFRLHPGATFTDLWRFMFPFGW